MFLPKLRILQTVAFMPTGGTLFLGINLPGKNILTCYKSRR